MPQSTRSLLPAGFYDLLHPDASFEAHLQGTVMQCLQQHGYQRVKPPLVEFEDSLLAGGSTKMDKSTFRLMDPLSQRMMGLRTDITMQIGRIALSRLKRMPKPLRLCYTGTVLTTIATDTLNPSRQHMQAGAELIGVETVASDIESISIAIETLQHIGVKRISVDINFPLFMRALLYETNVSRETIPALMTALAQKDIGPTSALPKTLRALLQELTTCFGPAEEVLPRIKSLDLPKAVTPMLTRIERIIKGVSTRCKDAELTLDLTESRGFDYHTGISFALFARGIEGEIGRGGRYAVAFDGETPAIGFTMYISRLLPILKAPKPQPRIYIPAGTKASVLQTLHEKEYITVSGLEDGKGKADKAALLKEAGRLNCQHIWLGGKAVSVTGNR